MVRDEEKQLIRQCVEALREGIPGFRSRRPQMEMIAAVANTWLNLQTNDELLAITQSTLKTREDSLRLTRLRLDNGASSALDVRQAESLTAGALAPRVDAVAAG